MLWGVYVEMSRNGLRSDSMRLSEYSSDYDIVYAFLEK